MNLPILRIAEDRGFVEYLSTNGEVIWSIAISSIILVAEYTTKAAMLEDDYFIVFVVAQGGIPFSYTGSFYSEGRDEILQELGRIWNAPVELWLASSTDWTSRVSWPQQLAGQEYFSFTEQTANSLRSRISKRMFGPTFEYRPSEQVLVFLKEQAKKI